MSDKEIIKEEGDWRVTIKRDEYSNEPYDDGQSPLLRIDRGYGYGGRSAEHVMVGGMRPTDSDARIEEAAARWAGKPDLFEKYLRAFHGATVIKWYGPNQSTDYTYVTYDTPEWSECIGYDDKCAPRADYDGAKAVNMDEYIAYLEGDVYSFTVERKISVKETREIGFAGEYLRDEEYEYDTWEHVDSCGGHYGYEWAKQAALEAFDDARESADA